MRLLICCLLLISASPVTAGAWLREKGTHFSSITLRWLEDRGDGSDGYEFAFYHIWGLRDDLTLGIDIGASASGLDKAMAFAQVPIVLKTGWVRLSAIVGIGTVSRSFAVRPSLAIGTSYEIAGMHGWFEVVPALEYDSDRQRVDAKLDVTLGLNTSENSKVYGQFFSSTSAEGKIHTRFEGSYVRRIKGRTLLDVGFSKGLVTQHDIRLKLGVWTEF